WRPRTARRLRCAQVPGGGNALLHRAEGEGDRRRPQDHGGHRAPRLDHRQGLALPLPGGADNGMSDPGSKPEWPEIERVMGHALQLPEEQRAAYLEHQPPEIRAEVESLLAAYRRSSDFLGNETSVQAFAAVKPGAELGPYRIEAIIGQGGMGVVYRAFDTKLH